MTLPKIAVTMGDPAGIGPEICLRLLEHAPVAAVCTPIVFGAAEVLRRAARACGLAAPERVIDVRDWERLLPTLDRPCVLDLPLPTLEQLDDPARFTPGVVTAATGEASFQYVEASIREALAGRVQAITTGPINKEALHMAGRKYPGHTEIFAERTNAARSCMMLTSPEITCSFVTTHVGYRDVPGLLTTAKILDAIDLTVAALRRIRNREPRLTVCALNPHAGEHGLFGASEEERIIQPAIDEARRRGLQIVGPLPPDTAFLPHRRRETDGYICMYHDQGHIPLKMLAFDTAINTTLGLSVLRTSVDHGTALDIAWQGVANPNSLYEAVLLAARLA